jgi:hypothetical protein
VAELRLAGIGSIPAANAYLKEIYLPQQHNIKFTVKPENHISAYQAIPPEMDLNQVFCMKEHRIVARDHTVSIKGEKWLIAEDLKYSIAKARIELRVDKWGDWIAYFANKPIKLVKIKKAKRLAA